MKRSTVALSAAGICIFAGAWVGSPFFMTHQMIAAAESRNDDDVFAGFDIAKVRENLRPAVTANVRPTDREVDGSIAGGFELLATPRFVDAMLDTILTPNHLGDLLRYGVLAKPDVVPPRNYAEAYQSPNVFVLDITPGDVQPVELKLEREGLFSWRVTRVTLPALAQAATAAQAAPSAAPTSAASQISSPPPRAESNQDLANAAVSVPTPAPSPPSSAAIGIPAASDIESAPAATVDTNQQ